MKIKDKIMSTYFYCELSYYKKLVIGFLSLNISVFLISSLISIQIYANEIYIISALLIVLNILISIFKIIFLSLGLINYDDCDDFSILQKAGNLISSIV